MSKTKTKRARREAKREHESTRPPRQLQSQSKSPLNSRIPPTQSAHRNKQHTGPLAHAAPSIDPRPVQASQTHEVPFGPYDRVLLVGEGDFSFTHCLCIHHGCADVTATSYDSEAEVRTKYPTFEQIETGLSELTPPVPIFHSIDAERLSTYKNLRSGDCNDEDDSRQGKEDGTWDTICFMFPHTGGLSTDVNRQVRANQALLVSFFNSCLELPAKKQRSSRTAVRPFLKMGGKIIVTLFEGEPYTLWNIRDLARHTGLKVVESYKFNWKDYPTYKHVRTLGAIEGGGGWKGEDRSARMYIFEKIPLEPDVEEERPQRQNKKKRKRRGDQESGSESD